MEEKSLIPIKTLSPAVVFTANGTDVYIEMIKKEVRGIVGDLGTAKGRGVYSAMNGQIRGHKATLDKFADGYTKQLRADKTASVVDYDAKLEGVKKEKTRMDIELDAFAKEMRKPLTDWQEAEDERKEEILRLMRKNERWDNTATANTSGEIRRSLEEVAKIEITTEIYQESRAVALERKESVLVRLKERLKFFEDREALGREKDKLKKKKETADAKAARDEIAEEERVKARKAAEIKVEELQQEAGALKREVSELKKPPPAVVEQHPQPPAPPPKEADPAGVDAPTPSIFTSDHKDEIHREIRAALESFGFSPRDSLKFVLKARDGEIPNVEIKY